MLLVSEVLVVWSSEFAEKEALLADMMAAVVVSRVCDEGVELGIDLMAEMRVRALGGKIGRFG